MLHPLHPYALLCLFISSLIPMSSSIPSTMRAVVTQKDGRAAVESVPVPSLAGNEVLVKIYAVTQNPIE